MQAINHLVAINFYLAVVVLMFGSILSVTGSLVFEFDEDLYGALDNNLRMMMVYLAATEAVIPAYCWFSKHFQYRVPVEFS